MKYFLDTEFIEDGKTIDLMSIGIVKESGEELYLESNECDLEKADDWIKENVISNLLYKPAIFLSREEIKVKILDFIGEDNNIEFWADYCSYDWVVLCQLFGRMIDIPNNFPYYCNDIQQLIKIKKVEVLPSQTEELHNALGDARYVKELYEYINRPVVKKSLWNKILDYLKLSIKNLIIYIYD